MVAGSDHAMKYKILIVDDQPAIRDMMRDFMIKEPYDILCAASAEKALAILEKETADVVISDEMMSGMTGTQFLAIVRRKYPDTIRIILTGKGSLETAIRAINEGEIYRFFTKPCNMADLIVTIRQALEQKELKKENLRLLNKLNQQTSAIESIEKKHPGITKVKRDKSGAVIIDDC